MELLIPVSYVHSKGLDWHKMVNVRQSIIVWFQMEKIGVFSVRVVISWMIKGNA